MFAEVFPSRLKEARKDNEMTQKEAAKFLKIGEATYSHYETGRTQPELETLAKMAKLFGVSADWLIGISSEEGSFLIRQAKEEKERQRILKKLEREAELARRLTA